jgi:adenylate cyclase
MSETRKLAAILCSDVVGFSRLAGADEDRILARLRALRSDLTDPTIAVHNGRVVKRTGDGSIVEFRSVVDAVRCAIEVQNGMIERNAGVPEDRRIIFRIGIHLGDVVEEADGDLMGDGVNIAARLEGIAQPGAICLSEDAYRQVKQRLDVKVIDLGATQLKNIAEPVHIYSLEVGQPARAKPALSATPTDPAKAASPKRRLGSAPLIAGIVALVLLAAATVWFLLGGGLIKPAQAAHLSIVVLPFANVSGDPAQDSFADRVTEDLTTDLSRTRSAHVVAHSTAGAFKGKGADTREIGKLLGVRYILEGSVLRDQNRVRVNAQLIDAQSGDHLWADRFEETVADSSELEDRILGRLANALRNQLVFAEANFAGRSRNPDATDLAMQGRALMLRRLPDKQQNDAATTLFEQALKLDSNESNALAGLAVAYAEASRFRWGANPVDNLRKALDLADRAIDLDPSDPAAYVAKAAYLAQNDRWNEVLRVANAGLANVPNSAALYAARSVAEGQVGRYEESISDGEKAKRLNPGDSEVLLWLQ